MSFDPGSTHVGLALWELSGGRWYCQKAKEVTPERFADVLVLALNQGKLSRVAGESFNLQSDKALQQIGSSFGTVECIGLARHECRWHGIELEEITPAVRKGAYKRMRAVQWRFPVGVPDHVWSAICVGACATGWSARNHFEGDGCDGPRLSR